MRPSGVMAIMNSLMSSPRTRDADVVSAAAGGATGVDANRDYKTRRIGYVQILRVLFIQNRVVATSPCLWATICGRKQRVQHPLPFLVEHDLEIDCVIRELLRDLIPRFGLAMGVAQGEELLLVIGVFVLEMNTFDFQYDVSIFPPPTWRHTTSNNPAGARSSTRRRECRARRH